MRQTTNSLAILILAQFGLSACDSDNSETLNSETLNSDDPVTDTTSSENSNTLSPSSPDTTNNSDPATARLDGRWMSSCTTRFPQDADGFEQEYLIVEGSSYERTINYFEDIDCSVPEDISFLRVRSTGLQYPGGMVETERGFATQIVVTSPIIDFDRRLLTEDEAALFDPALHFYDFYLFGEDGRLYFGSMNTGPTDQFEQTLDSPHIFTAQ